MMKKFILIPVVVCLCSCHNLNRNEKVTPAEQLQLKFLQGWNSWNNPNVLSYVYMPDGFALQLVFRNKQGGPYWLRDSYIAGTNTNFPEKITPLSHAYDGSYTDLIIEWPGMKAKVTTH